MYDVLRSCYFLKILCDFRTDFPTALRAANNRIVFVRPLSFTSVNIFVKKGLGMRVCDDAFIVERSWTFETDPL